MFDLTPNMAVEIPNRLAPTAYESICPGAVNDMAMLDLEQSVVSITNGDLSFEQPVFHYYEMTKRERLVMQDALLSDVSIIDSGELISLP